MRRPLPSRLRAWLLALLIVGAAGPASAIVVRFTAEDLPDPPESSDRWRYVYTVDAFPYDAGWGFTVYFDQLLYEAIETPLPAVGVGWNAQAYQPDPFGDEGYYDAEATADLPSVATGFAVVFHWLGAGTPGAQPVELRDPIYEPIELGMTVPEPTGAASPIAALAGLAAVAAGRRAREGDRA